MGAFDCRGTFRFIPEQEANTVAKWRDQTHVPGPMKTSAGEQLPAKLVRP